MTINRAGIACFAIRPTIASGQLMQAQIEGQGYLAVHGEYLLYGSLTINQAGEGVVVMMLTGPDYFPSMVYTTFFVTTSGKLSSFSSLRLVASGNGPAFIGACQPKYGGICTWGNYPAATFDNAGNFWLASEYVPGNAVTRYENWGTYIVELVSAAQ